MKSFFLATLLSGLISSVAFAQNAKKKKKPIDPPANPRATKVSTMPVAKTAKPESKTHFDRFYDRLSIGYFAAYSSSPLNRFHADFSATSPQLEGGKGLKHCNDNCDDYTQNIFNLITFNYAFGGGNKFFIQPRWTIFLGKVPKDYDYSQVLIEDALVGWSTNLFTSMDKKFAWNLRPAVRLPTSRGSRNGDARNFGDLTHQPDIVTSLSYTASENWSFGYSLQNRFWVYEDRYNESRHRVAQTVNANQKITDKTSLSYNFDFWVQNERTRPSINDQEVSYKKNWQSAYVGLSTDVTPKLNITPVIGAFPDDPNFGLRSAFLNLWVAYTIK